MTDAGFFARGSRPLIKPTTCEECFAISTCKMHGNFKQLELTTAGYAKLLKGEKAKQ
jgi:hypothetical protein